MIGVSLAVGAPLALALLWVLPAGRPLVERLFPWAALPALLLAVLGEEGAVELPWMLLGARLGLDPVARVLLGLAAGLWLVSGLYAGPLACRGAGRERYALFHLLTLAGNVGAVLSQDMVSFASWFALMSWASYGLIVCDDAPASHRAGRVYLAAVLVNELLLTWAAVFLARNAESLLFTALAPAYAAPGRGLAAGLLLVAFGTKMGVMPLHVWMPLAYPAAPTPAAAALGGAVVATGALGLVRFLPLGEAALAPQGAALLAFGLISALLAALLGTTQRAPAAVLAYSSASQMGLAAAVLGASLVQPSLWTTGRQALLLFLVHHGLAKAALFLGAGLSLPEEAPAWQRRLRQLGMGVPALALAGLPLTSGFVAKDALKYATALPGGWGQALGWLLPLTSAATLLLMLRLLALPPPQRGAPAPREVGAFVLLAASPVLLLFGLWATGRVDPAWLAVDAGALGSALWPLLGAGALAGAVRARPELARRLGQIEIPAGDVVVLLERWAAGIRWLWQGLVARLTALWRAATDRVGSWSRRSADRVVDGVAGALEHDLTAGWMVGALALLLFLLLAR